MEMENRGCGNEACDRIELSLPASKDLMLVVRLAMCWTMSRWPSRRPACF